MRVIVLLFLTLIVISINAHPVKIGYIDVEKVVNSLSQYQKDNETLSQQFEAKKQELLDLFKHIELLNKNLNNVDKLTNNDAYQKELEKIQVEKTRRAYDEPIGKMVSKEGYTFYFHDRKEKRVASLTFDPKVGQITRYGEYEVPLKRAEIITSFPYNDRMMMLVLEKRDGVLTLYELGSEVIKSTTINPEKLGIVDAEGQPLSLRRELRENGIEAVAILEQKLAPGVRKNTEPFKVFRYDDQLQWLIDTSSERSQLVTISLQNFEHQNSF